jgi:hypothetical protein
MWMGDDVEAPYGVNLESNMAMKRDCNDDEEEDEEYQAEEQQQQMEQQQQKEQDEMEEEDEDDDKDEDDGKEPLMIAQVSMGNIWTYDVDTKVDNQPFVIHEQDPEMCGHTLRPQHPVSAPCPQTLEPHPRPPSLEIHPLSVVEFEELVAPQKPCTVVPTLEQAEAASNTLDVNVNRQLLGNSEGEGRFPNLPHPDVALPDANPDGSVGTE